MPHWKPQHLLVTEWRMNLQSEQSTCTKQSDTLNNQLLKTNLNLLKQGSLQILLNVVELAFFGVVGTQFRLGGGSSLPLKSASRSVAHLQSSRLYPKCLCRFERFNPVKLYGNSCIYELLLWAGFKSVSQKLMAGKASPTFAAWQVSALHEVCCLRQPSAQNSKLSSKQLLAFDLR